ncbi:MAG: hypothetical protein QXG26_03225 [Candidatus Aenigmatarchaeota archaeon]
MLEIEEGILMSYWCFDISDEIFINEIEKLLGKKAETTMLVCRKLTPEYVQYKTPPLFIRLGKEKIGKSDWSIDIKIYDFGDIIIRASTEIKGSTNEITKFFNQVEPELKKKIDAVLGKITEEIKNYIHKPPLKIARASTSYNIFFVHKFGKGLKPKELIERYGSEIAHLLRYETKGLSEQEIKDVLKMSLSYYAEDLTIIDFNSALVYDPRKSYDVPDVLEYAIIELTELRMYDDLLDKVIETAYDELGKKRFFGSGAILNKLSQIRLDISEVIEKVENYIKLIDDSYLGKVYASASNRFYLEKWKISVKEKMELLESLYAKNWERLQTRRMLWLETSIVALFILDVILIFYEIFG